MLDLEYDEKQRPASGKNAKKAKKKEEVRKKKREEEEEKKRAVEEAEKEKEEEREKHKKKQREKEERLKTSEELERAQSMKAGMEGAERRKKEEVAQERADVAAAVAAVAAAVAAEEAAKEEASLKKAAAKELTITVGKLTYCPFLPLGSEGKEVFRGEWDGMFCAIKKQPLSVFKSKRDEVKFLRKLSHENIVNLHGYEKNSESYFIALELCHDTLDDLVVPSEARARSETSDRLPRPLADVEKLRDVLSQTLAAIKFLHLEDVVHR